MKSLIISGRHSSIALAFMDSISGFIDKGLVTKNLKAFRINLTHKSKVIIDGAGYHRAKDLKEKAVNLNIKLQYLPPYSPNLNPIERLWKVMNEHFRDNRYFATAKEFRDKIDEFFNQTHPEIGDSLGTRINDNFQVLNPAS